MFTIYYMLLFNVDQKLIIRTIVVNIMNIIFTKIAYYHIQRERERETERDTD